MRKELNGDMAPEMLRQLHRIFFPDVPTPFEWYDQLALFLQKQKARELDVVAYFHALYLHGQGLASNNAIVEAGMSAPREALPHFGSMVTLMIHARDSEKWLEQTIQFYERLGVLVVFALDSKTSKPTRDCLVGNGASYIEFDKEDASSSITEHVVNAVTTEWVLWFSDSEVPSPALINFVNKAVKYSTEFMWGFRRIHCRYAARSGELQYSQFLPFGPFASESCQWRLVAKHFGVRQKRSAPYDAVFLNLDWVTRPLMKRIDWLESSKSPGGQTVSGLSPLLLMETIPESWHMFAPLRSEAYIKYAQAIWKACGVK